MDFIFMLTRQDRTIADCLELFELIRPLKLGHVGFKDIGVSPETLSKLAGAIRDSVPPFIWRWFRPRRKPVSTRRGSPRS